MATCTSRDAAAIGCGGWASGPRGPANSVFASLDCRTATFSTSGDYERFFIKGGRRYHHIIDPDRGEPAAAAAASRSSAIARSSRTGSRRASSSSARKGMALIERLPQVEGVIVTAKNQVLVSSGLKERLEIVWPPTEGGLEDSAA